MVQIDHCRPYVRERLDYIRETWATMSCREQAAALGLPYGTVSNYRSLLIQAGIVHARDRRNHRPWTSDDIEWVETMISGGFNIRWIAGRLGRSISSVQAAVRFHSTHGSIDAIRNQSIIAVRSQRQVAALFCVSPYRIAQWIAHGWLVARYNHPRNIQPRSRRCQRLITDDAICAFLAVREAWPTYTPEQITDPDWRDRASELRTPDGYEWISTVDYARRTHYSRAAVHTRLHTQNPPLIAHKIGGVWFIRWPQPSADAQGTL